MTVSLSTQYRTSTHKLHRASPPACKSPGVCRTSNSSVIRAVLSSRLVTGCLFGRPAAQVSSESGSPGRNTPLGKVSDLERALGNLNSDPQGRKSAMLPDHPIRAITGEMGSYIRSKPLQLTRARACDVGASSVPRVLPKRRFCASIGDFFCRLKPILVNFLMQFTHSGS